MEQQTVITSVNVEARKKLGVRPGDTVRVMQKIQEKGKTRLQAFEGIVLSAKHGAEAGASFTVRKVASGVGVEKTFPLYSPMIDKIEVIKRTKVRRSKLYYIREKAAKVIRRSMRNAFMVGDSIESDIAEKERLVKEAEEVEKKAEEEAAAAEAKAAEEAKNAEEEVQKDEAPVETEEEPKEGVEEDAAKETDKEVTGSETAEDEKPKDETFEEESKKN